MIESQENSLVLKKWGIPFYKIQTPSDTLMRQYCTEVSDILSFLDTKNLGAECVRDYLNKNKGFDTYSLNRENQLIDALATKLDSPNLTSDEKILLGIAFWQYVRLKKISNAVHVVTKGLARVLPGLGGKVSVSIEDLLSGKKVFNCFDSSAITQLIAQEFGITGTVARYKITESRNLHFFFKADSGTVIDINLGSLSAGFFENTEEHKNKQESKLNRKNSNYKNNLLR